MLEFDRNRETLAVVESQAKEKKSRAFRTFPTEVLVTSGNDSSIDGG